MTAGDWRPLPLKRDGTCVECGVALPAGTAAEWSRARRAVRCLGHEETTAIPTQPRSTGTAGASAHAEYERRAARREQRIRAKHPRLGGFLLAVSNEPQHVRAWKAGAAGERAVGRHLDELIADGVEVMHDRRIPRTKANIDHIAVSSSGVYVIDAKNYTSHIKVDWYGGLFTPRQYKLLVGRRD